MQCGLRPMPRDAVVGWQGPECLSPGFPQNSCQAGRTRQSCQACWATQGPFVGEVCPRLALQGLLQGLQERAWPACLEAKVPRQLWMDHFLAVQPTGAHPDGGHSSVEWVPGVHLCCLWRLCHQHSQEVGQALCGHACWQQYLHPSKGPERGSPQAPQCQVGGCGPPRPSPPGHR